MSAAAAHLVMLIAAQVGPPAGPDRVVWTAARAATLTAAWLAPRRASQIDPVQAMRS